MTEVLCGPEGEPLVDAVTSNPYFDDKVDQSVERVARKRKVDFDSLSRMPAQVSTGRALDVESDVSDGRVIAVT